MSFGTFVAQRESLEILDDEIDGDDEDGGLTEARRELARGEGSSTEELERELGLA